MRVCLALSNDNGLESMVSEHFGQCEFFLVADIENKKIIEYKVVKNNVVHGGGGCQTVNEAVQYKIDVMIAGGMGANAKYKFANFGVQLFSFVGSAKEALEKLIEKELGGISSCKEHGGVCE